MWIRSTRLQGDVNRLDEAVNTYRQKIGPAMAEMAGYMGTAVLANRETGLAESVVYWQDEAALKATEASTEEMRARVAAELGAKIISVDRLELVIVERAAPVQEGTFVRTNDVQGDPAKLDEGTAFIRDKVIKVLTAQPGFRALVTGINRQTGRSVTASTWDSMDALKKSEAAVVDLREQAVKASGATGVKVEIWESVFVEMKTAATLTS
jgi:heme-degrading monooxygenase HmoA